MKKILYDLFDVAKTVIIVLIISFATRYYIFQPFVVEGHSMDPNFYDQEYLLVNKLTYRIGEPKRGDVVVFQAPNNPQYDYIKRIIGLPGEKVAITNSTIYINGEKIDESYLDDSVKTYIKNDPSMNLEVTLADDEYFVLGDNREHSSDSREWGILPYKNIVGKAWFSVYPWNIFGVINTPNYNF